MGRAASAWALEHRNVWRKAPAVLDLVEQRSRPARLLRRVDTFWVSSWGSACGIAEYTAHLAHGLPSVSVTAQAPDPRRVRVLHVQHEDSLFADVELSQHVTRARQAGVPVAVTEHTVGSRAHVWEGEVDALVALTASGAHLLRSRWQGKRVEHIPHGCPTWFPPRKRARGRVIGAFGFLEPHKGFHALLDVLRAMPGVELLLFSHARTPEMGVRWDEASRGLPVRRVGGFLPVEEVARRLAAEADMLAFWYDEVPHASASGAVRVGLATGVPVLASPTGWFAELRDVTYQPTSLLEGVRRLLDDAPLGERLATAARDYCHDHSWGRTAERHQALWRSLGAA
jgi:glycosyltransferase involved in cell wall biosynthesis